MTTQTIDIDTELHTGAEFLRRLTGDVAKAAAEHRLYAIVACVPQHLPGEGIADVMKIAAKCIGRVVRDGDVAGHLDGNILAIGLANTDPTEARVFAHRLQGDFELLSSHLRNTVWDAGLACFPSDGASGRELLQAAVQAARTRRRRLAG